MRILKLLAVVIVSVLLFTQCSEDDAKDIQKPLRLEGMMYFDSFEDYVKTQEMFSSFGDNSGFEEWERQQKGYVSIFSTDKISLKEKDEIPYRYLFLLNENKEFQIANKLIRYCDNLLYEYEIDNTGKISEQHKVFGGCDRIVDSLSAGDSFDTLDDNGRVSYVTLSLAISKDKVGHKTGEINRVSYTSTKSCDAGTPKSLRYKLEYYLLTQSYWANKAYSVRWTDLSLKFRMAHKTSGGSWDHNNTSTYRRLAVNLNVDYNLGYEGDNNPNLGNHKSIVFGDKNNCNANDLIKGTKEFIIEGGTATSMYSPKYWYVNLYGSIYHKVNGDVESNAYDETINW